MKSRSPAVDAIILAAGRGARLSESNPDSRPKCLLEIGGRSLLSRMLEALARWGIRHCHIVIGYEGNQIVDHVETLLVRPEVSFHYNSRYTEGSVISLAVARDVLMSGRDIVLMDADVLFHPGILGRLIGSEIDNCYLMDRGFEPGAEPVKIALRNGEMVEFSKHLPSGLAYDKLGESVGFFRFSAACASRIAERCDGFVESGRGEEPHENALREELLARPEDFGVEDITGLPWLEIDFSEDIERANQQILPAIRAEHPEY